MKKTKKKEKKPTFQISGLAFEVCARMIIIIVVLYTLGTAIVDFPLWQVWLVDIVMLWWAINPVWRILASDCKSILCFLEENGKD